MGTPIAFNSGTTASYDVGVFKKGTVALNLANTLASGYNWWNGVDVTSSQYLIYSDTFSQGQATFANSRPTAWTTPDLNDSSLVALINTLPDRVGLPLFTDVTSAVNWMNQTGKYYLVKTGYDDIVTTNLQFNVDAGWYNSYPGTGTSWFDTSPNTTTCTLFNGVGFSSLGQGSLVFDGTDDYVRIPDVSSLDIPTAITVEAWVYYDAQGGSASYSVITHKGYPWNWLLEDQNGIFNFRITTSNNSDSNLSSGYAHGLKKWNHVAATYDGSNQRIYVNGVLTASQALTGTITTTSSDLFIGAYTPSTYNLTGKVAIVRVYSSALSQSNIIKNFNAQRYRFGINNDVVTAGLVFDIDAKSNLSYPGSGTQWFDLTGLNSPTNLFNGPTYSTDGYIQFDGSDDYGKNSATPQGFNMNSTNAITAEGLIYYSPSDYDFWFSANQGGGIKYRFGTAAAGTFYWDMGQHVDRTYGGYTLPSNTWNYVTFTGGIENGQIVTRVYVNGVFIVSQNESISSLTTIDDFYIGTGESSSSHPFNGRISSIKVYNRVLSEVERLQNYYQGSIVTDSLLVLFDASNLVSYPGSGTVWKDLSSNANNGTLQNGVGFSLSNGGVLTFDGINDQVATSVNRGNLGNTMSVDAFFKYTGNASDSYRPIIGGSDPGAGTEFFLGKNTGNNHFGVQDGNYNGSFVSNYDVFDGQWHHFCYTYENGVGKLYLDGLLRATGNFSKCNDAELIFVGAEVQEGYWWKGDIGKVSYYTKTLNALEVSQNFQAQKSRFGL